MYKIDINPGKKLLSIVAEGMFNLDEAKKYKDDFVAKLNSINPREYSFLADGRKQTTSTPEVGQILAEVLNIYKEAPFKKRYLVKLDSVIAMSQVKRLCGADFDQIFTVVNTPEEVINSL